MNLGHTQYLPVAPPMFALLAGALALLLILIQIRVFLERPLMQMRTRAPYLIANIDAGELGFGHGVFQSRCNGFHFGKD
jgi:hypothetical protein